MDFALKTMDYFIEMYVFEKAHPRAIPDVFLGAFDKVRHYSDIFIIQIMEIFYEANDDFVLQMMVFVLNMMNSALKMLNCVLQMMNLVIKNE